MQNRAILGSMITALASLCGTLNAQDFFWGNQNNHHFSSPVVGNTGTTPYRIIPRPMTEHDGKTLSYSATVQASPAPDLVARPTKPYAYGWFGPQDTPQWQRHFGYHSRYTQWTLK